MRRSRLAAVTSIALSMATSRPSTAAKGAASPSPSVSDESLFQALDFRLVGPFSGGRSTGPETASSQSE